MHRSIGAVLAMAITLSLSDAAAAQLLHPGYGVVGAPMSTFLSSSYLSQQLVNDTNFKRGVTGKVDLPPGRSTGFHPSPGGSGVAAELAQSYPPASRVKAQHAFEELLAGYAKLEHRFGIPPRDLAGATAAFVAGSYMGYHNADFPDASFPPLVEQMRSILAGMPGMRSASDSQKRELYEHMAIMGMFMATTQMALKQRPDAQTESQMRLAAKGYLEQFLKTDADRVQITAKGLALR